MKKLLFTREPSPGLRALFFCALAISTMVLDYRHHRLDAVRAALSVVVLPIQYTVDWPTKVVNVIKTDLVTRKNLLAENARLKDKQLLLQSDLQKMALLEEENSQLRSLLNSAPKTSSNKILVAQLLQASPDPSVSEVTIDKGKKDNAYQGQPVLDAQGVMGQVIQAGPLSSRVLLITDTRSAVPVQNTRTGARFIAVGNGSEKTLNLMHIPETADIKVGDKLVTSGLDGSFPVGYPVGVITKVSRVKGESFTIVKVEASAHLHNRQVLLAWPNTTLAAIKK